MGLIRKKSLFEKLLKNPLPPVGGRVKKWFKNQLYDNSSKYKFILEHHRIVAKLDQLMQTCDALEGSIKESMEQNERLLQEVLREALTKEE